MNGKTGAGSSAPDAPSSDTPKKDVAAPPSALPDIVHELPASVLDGEVHYGVAITVTASGKPSILMIPDATRIKEGEPIYITGRIAIHGENLKDFLANKGVKLPPAIDRLITETQIDCDAFYYSTHRVQFRKEDDTASKLKERLALDGDPWNKWLEEHKVTGSSDKYEVNEGPLLMMFSINFDKGLIGALTGDEHLGSLFDVTRGSIRVVRCPANKQDVLKQYVKLLQAAETSP